MSNTTTRRDETAIQEWTRRCQDKLKNPKWFPWEFEAVQGGLLCTGAECPLYTIGPKKGQPNYKRANMDTLQKLVLKSRVHKGRPLRQGEVGRQLPPELMP